MERLGLVGLPNSGKTSLFNALTGADAPVASHPFTTTETVVAAAPLVRAAICDGKANGEFRADLPEKIAANCFFGAIDEMVTSWVLSEKDYPLSHVAEPILDILLNGMRAASK